MGADVRGRLWFSAYDEYMGADVRGRLWFSAYDEYRPADRPVLHNRPV